MTNKSSESLMDLKKSLTPGEYAKALQSRGPIFWQESGGMWVITDYALAQSVLKNPRMSCDRAAFFIRRMPDMDISLITDFFEVVSKMMVMSDGEKHHARRRVCYHGFSTQAINRLIPVVRKSIDDSIDEIISNQRFEFVADLVREIPSKTLASFFNIPESGRLQFYKWSHNMTQFFGGASKYQNEDGIEVNHSASQLRSYFSDLIRHRRRHPKEDFLSMLVKHQHHFGLTDDEIVSQAIMMLVAGQVTTTDQMANGLYILLSDPDKYRQMCADPDLIPFIVDETIRLDPAVTYLFRVASEKMTLAGQEISAGDVIFISNHAANRDPAAFHHAHHYRPSQLSKNHLGFGFGSHFCLGAKLGKLEMELCYAALAQRLPNLRLDPERGATRLHHSLAFSGFETLNCVVG